MMRKARHMVLLLSLFCGMVGNAFAQPLTFSAQKSVMGIEVHFRFDQYQLDLDYMGNEQALQRFADVIDSIGLYRVDSIVIVSQSSPEGSYEHNRKLSINRARTMRQHLESRYPHLGDYLYVHPDGESWDRLREYVKKDTRMKQSTIDRVLSVIDSDVNIATKKWRMQQLPVYRYLLTTYYPRIRNSVFCIIYFDGVDFVTATPPAPTEVLVEKEPVAERPVYLVVNRDPVFSIRTNLLYDLVSVFNVGFEYYPGDTHWSLLGSYTFPWWGSDKIHCYLQILDGQLEARRYFAKNIDYTGHYLSAYGHVNLYDIAFGPQHGWQGEGRGAGIGYGYVWRVDNSRRWKMEAFVKVGYYETRFDPYHAGDPYHGKYYYDWPGMPEDFVPRNYRTRWFGPTGVGVTISYDLIYRRVKNKNRY